MRIDIKRRLQSIADNAWLIHSGRTTVAAAGAWALALLFHLPEAF